MRNEQINNKIAAIISKTIEEDIKMPILNDYNLIEQYNLDSLQCLEILVLIESEFNITIEDSVFTMKLLNSTQNLIEFIENRVSLNENN